MAIRTARWTRTSPWNLLSLEEAFSEGTDLPLANPYKQHKATKRTDLIHRGKSNDSASTTHQASPNTSQWMLNTGGKHSKQNWTQDVNQKLPTNKAIDAADWNQEAWEACASYPQESPQSLKTNESLPPLTALADLSLTFKLQSRPNASKIIYLDFNGHTTTGTQWNDSAMGTSFYSPAYDTDDDPTTFSDNELISIQNIWQRVAADFSPFDVNVTLQEPPPDWLSRDGSSDSHWGVRSVVTSYGPSSSSAGGIAFIGSFNSSLDTPVYIYNKSTTGICEAISHEVGHALWLAHDGTSSTSYYNGHGGIDETSWAPIMGSSYNRNVTTWDDGTYNGSNNTGSTANYGKGADDLAVIAGNNGFSYQADTEGDDLLTATPLPITSGHVEIFGTIETRLDTDWFTFSLLDTGDIDITLDPYWYRAFIDVDGSWGGPYATQISRISDIDSSTPYPDTASNLDISASLYDETGRLLYQADSTSLTSNIYLQDMAASTYYLKLDGVGFGDPTSNTPTGYSDYASIGNYMITGTITSAADSTPKPTVTLSCLPISVSEDGDEPFIYTFSRSTTGSPLEVYFTISGTATNGADYTGLTTGSGLSVKFEANERTSTLVVDPVADNIVEADETVSLMLSAGTDYIIGTATATTGTISNDDLAPTPLIFTSRTDVLTGSALADNFTLNRLSDALWSTTPDRITNLQAGIDAIDTPFDRSSSIKLKQLGAISALDTSGLERLLSNKNFSKYGASTFTFGSGNETRTFLAINDAIPGFKASSDSVIEITGYTGSLATLEIF